MLQQCKRLGIGAIVGSVLLLSARASHAQAFHESGQVSVALERAFGIHYVNSEVDRPGAGDDQEFSGTSVGIGWSGALTPLQYTRAAIDGFVTDQLSLGGSLGFYSQSGEDWDASGFLLSPRVGYAIPLSRVFTFWPRGGFTYYDIEQESEFAVTGEAMFVASPQPSWGILFGLTLDLIVAGDASNDGDRSGIVIGLPAVGLMGTF